ncbi:endonuclease/exonuclease/phosphatase family protein [Membranihabitans maritimus]|uniref:endonuclease/exonuclease/phosphatase family protein n=1 Tax=Membranihabitans maritimus TaxID=2904244 RepID=UPI001F18169F|nr:endonuclease/exonuclease/phosphatase family protein [Membranihabitans maritimus]
MKFMLTLFFIVGSFFLQAQETTDTLKILCYNIRFGEKASLEELAKYIKSEDPDLVALQEVDCRTHRDRAPAQNGKDFMSELGYLTGLMPSYGKTIPYKGGYYGIGILSRFPSASIQRIYLPMTNGGKEQRALLMADVEIKEGKYITFASTHLDYINSDVRWAQVSKLNKVLKEASYPVIVAGDFNARPEYTEISEGMGEWKSLSNTDPTASAESPKYKIDYIFGYPVNAWKLIETKTPKIQLSDHLPIVTSVSLRIN